MNKEQVLLCSAWRKAATMPDGLTIPCPTKADATRLRFSLYTAVKFAKKPGALVDEALQHALEVCSVTVQSTPPAVIISPRMLRPVMRTLEELVGGDSRPPEAQSAAESQARLLELLGSGGSASESEAVAEAKQALAEAKEVLASVPRKATPYYTR